MLLKSPTDVLDSSFGESETSTSSTSKRPAEDHDAVSPTSVKRRAHDNDKGEALPKSSPAMDEKTSTKKVESLTPPKAPKKISLYMRFKSVLLKEAEDKGDIYTVRDISNIAKNAWARVKNTNTSDVDIEAEENRPLANKAKAEQDEKKELAKYKAKLHRFQNDFHDAAISFLHWKTESAQEDTMKKFQKQITMVDRKASAAWGKSDSGKPDAYSRAHSSAMTKLQSLQKKASIRDLTSMLQNATDDQLQQHVTAHVDLLQQIEKMSSMEKELSAFRKQQQIQMQKEEKSAQNIKSDICRGLYKLMVYTSPALKYDRKKITYTRESVSRAMFAKAFDVPEGTVKYTFDGYEVGSKSLRYSSLSCNDVNVTLRGETLTATTKYGFGY